MINPKELRIGNCVNLYEEKGVLVEVESINKHGINLYAAYQVDDSPITRVEFNSNKLFGIELTPEILEEFGFEKLDSNPALYLKEWNLNNKEYPEIMQMYINTKNFWVFLYDANSEDSVDVREPKKYLHQLQNLWYDITGEELQKKSQ